MPKSDNFNLSMHSYHPHGAFLADMRVLIDTPIFIITRNKFQNLRARVWIRGVLGKIRKQLRGWKFVSLFLQEILL